MPYQFQNQDIQQLYDAIIASDGGATTNEVVEKLTELEILLAKVYDPEDDTAYTIAEMLLYIRNILAESYTLQNLSLLRLEALEILLQNLNKITATAISSIFTNTTMSLLNADIQTYLTDNPDRKILSVSFSQNTANTIFNALIITKDNVN